MKIILLLFIMTITLFGSEIEWECSYDEAMEQAKKENKRVLVVISTENCRW